MRLNRAEKTFALQMDCGFRLGLQAWEQGKPLTACPFGAGFEIPEDAEEPRHMGWLYGWWEGEMFRREDLAWQRGWDAGFAGAIQTMGHMGGERENDHYTRGWIAASVWIREGCPARH